jgi:hypothetical protein
VRLTNEQFVVGIDSDQKLYVAVQKKRDAAGLVVLPDDVVVALNRALDRLFKPRNSGNSKSRSATIPAMAAFIGRRLVETGNIELLRSFDSPSGPTCDHDAALAMQAVHR